MKSMKFHLAHIVPSKTMHGLNGYKEIIDTVQWGLQQLGHSAAYGLNSLSSNAINIIFGAQVMDPDVLNKLPPETIVYNFEQTRGLSPENVKPMFHIAAKRLRVWEYSEGNAGVWNDLGAKDVRIVPIGFAPILQRIERPAIQDIDVLIYGLPGNDRLAAFHHLSHAGLTTLFICGLYGKARDELIGRSKVVVNINLYDGSKIFEIARVSYLLANRKAVVADIDPDTTIDDDMRSAVKITTPSQLVQDCEKLVADEAARSVIEEAGFAAFARRDIRPILRGALGAATADSSVLPRNETP
jgi:hypothetical protein